MSGVKGQRSGGHNRLSVDSHRLRGTLRGDRHQAQALAISVPADLPVAPDGLSPASAALWAAILREYALTSAPSLELLESALRSRDVAEQARATLETEGLTYRGVDGAPKAHPAAAIHRDARAAFVSVLRVLGFPEEAQA
jgi:phage terminase small subunit